MSNDKILHGIAGYGSSSHTITTDTTSWEPIDTYDSITHGVCESKEDLVKIIEKDVSRLDSRKRKLKTLSDDLQKCQYGISSIVHHKELGTCLVQKFRLTEAMIAENCCLEVLLAHGNGNTWVTLEEVLERTEMTKAMYE